MYSICHSPGTGKTRMFPGIGSDMTKLYPEYPDRNIPGGQASAVGLASYSSKSSYLAMKRWIDDCATTHGICNRAYKQLGRHLPTRVIDVGVYDNDPIRLCISGGKMDHYIALSHCWGPKNDTNILRTIQATYVEYQKRIPLDKLPKTFKDAVTITRLLGIRYLWIDSLCIIQDSPDDWRHECQLMTSVYQSAFLVISATASYDSTGGCFHDSLREVEWEHKNAAGEPALLYIRQSHDHSVFGEKDARCIVRTGEMYGSEFPTLPSPVFRRAWCHQERLLGSRVIHFGDTELIFECLTSVNCECGALSNKPQDDSFKLFSGDAVVKSNPLHTDPQRIGQIWKEIIESYSVKDITYHADKLPALSGLAKFLHRGMGNYYAGTFKESLLSCLLWSSSSPEKKRRPDTYVAPSVGNIAPRPFCNMVAVALDFLEPQLLTSN
jgi:Heterokaryon incompatibility protein (HET)